MRLSLAVAATLCLGLTGCIKSMLLNGQIEGTRVASGAFDTIADYELAGSAAASGIVQFEGMHKLAPNNLNALFLLTKAWTGYSYGYGEDAMEVAEDDGDRALAEYHRKRAIRGYERAVGYGVELLAHRAEGFEGAKKDEASLKAWLDENFTEPEDAADLFWLGYAWLARGNLMKDDPESVANLFVAVGILGRSEELDAAYNNYTAGVVLAAYHARTAMAEIEEAKKRFDNALEKTGHKSLIVLFNYATKYACARADNVLYDKLLREVLASEEDAPEFRLTNTIARRRAKRWLGEKRMFDMCGMDPAPPAAG